MAWYRRVKVVTVGGFVRHELHLIEGRGGRPPVEGVVCKSCGGRRIQRFGSYKGKQRYRCKNCETTFMEGDALPHMRMEPEVVGSALHQFYEGMSLNGIRRQLRQDYELYPSDATIYRWVARFTPKAVKILDSVRVPVGSKWVADELMTPIEGHQTWVWDVMDTKSRWLLASRISLTSTSLQKRALSKTVRGELVEPHPSALRQAQGERS